MNKVEEESLSGAKLHDRRVKGEQGPLLDTHLPLGAAWPRLPAASGEGLSVRPDEAAGHIRFLSDHSIFPITLIILQGGAHSVELGPESLFSTYFKRWTRETRDRS